MKWSNDQDPKSKPNEVKGQEYQAYQNLKGNKERDKSQRTRYQHVKEKDDINGKQGNSVFLNIFQQTVCHLVLGH